ncbi:hypothetical protein TNCV_4640711 [Trichonephila clavipes]|nr:hypothetical protein TNCV_4640711 [Trichonephila clavipes]
MIKTNPMLTSTEVGFKLGIHQTIALDYIKTLNFMSKLSIWVPHKLSGKDLMDRNGSYSRQPDFTVSQPDLERPVEFSIAAQKGVLVSLLGKPVTAFYSVRKRRCTRVTDLNSVNQTTANNLTKSLPNASSDSDLPRYRHKSPSISNDTPEAAAARAAAKENSQSSTTSKFLKDMQAHSKHHVGEKVAQFRVTNVGIDSKRAPSVPNASTLSITPRRSSSRDV